MGVKAVSLFWTILTDSSQRQKLTIAVRIVDRLDRQ